MGRLSGGLSLPNCTVIGSLLPRPDVELCPFRVGGAAKCPSGCSGRDFAIRRLKEAINLEEKRRYVAKALVLLFMALFLLACGPTPPALKTVPVATRLVETPLEAGEPTGHTVMLFGKVIDSQTREEIRLAQVMIESDRGKKRFGSPFAFSFPTMSIITLTTSAPSYQTRQEVIKPHYRRDVTLTIDIPLVPIPMKTD